LVEGDDAVRLGIVDWLALRCRLQRLEISLAVLQRAEERKAEQLVGPHVEAAERDAKPGAVARPQRLDVAHLLEVTPDVACAPRRVEGGEFRIGLALSE